MAARRSNPVVVLVAIAVIVAVGLGVLWRVAASRAEPSDDAAPVQADDPIDPSLVTPALSFRRAPVTLSRTVNLASFEAALQPLVSGLPPESCVAVSIDGRLVAAAGEELPLLPASTMKLVVGAVALEVLGEDHRFTTSVLGEVDAAGVVDGDLHLVGGGDPLLSTTAWAQSETTPVLNATLLDGLVDDLLATGLTRITGDVVGDGSRYDDEWFVPSWEDDIRVTESGPYDALMVDDSLPAVFQGIEDPATGAAEALRSALVARGVTVDGVASSGRTPELPELATLDSAPLPEVLEEMLTTSDDNTAELLLKEIGFVGGGDGSREGGIRVVEDALERWELDLEGVIIADGSGLSNDNRLTCAVLLGVLQHGDVTDPVGAGLPVAGRSGTLADLFVGTGLEGRLQAKTGRRPNDANTTAASDPTGARTLAGYLPVDGGGAVEVVLVLNGQTITDDPVYQPIWFELLAPALASYPTVASPSELAPG